jgi:iron complex transport system substrate-binding protein
VRRDLCNPALGELRAVREGKLYGVLPHYYAASPDTVLAETYFIGKVLYPERFADIDIATLADDLYRFFVGRPLYAEMTQIFGGFKRLETGL